MAYVTVCVGVDTVYRRPVGMPRPRRSSWLRTIRTEAEMHRGPASRVRGECGMRGSFVVGDKARGTRLAGPAGQVDRRPA